MNSKTKERLFNSVFTQAEKTLPPTNYYLGLQRSRQFELPNNILCFFHNFESPQYQHRRYCIVIPFDPLIYVMNGIPQKVLPGMAVTQQPFAAHSIKAINGRCRRLHIAFELSTTQDYFPSKNYSEINTSCLRTISRILHAFHRQDTMECAFEIYRLCKMIKGEPLEETNDSTEANDSSKELKAMVDSTSELRSYIRENIKSISAHLKMSESNLRLRFRKENGISLGKYLQKLKLENAQYSLKYTQQSISEISTICGYDSVFSFSRFFKAKTGLSPLQWRKMNKGKELSDEELTP
ncbi:MAG: helix-turn-helix transcriptional regulator [Victivallales bacterium]|nr:helix-turn-helix transcriptional regulator [Victivallales bacterium]